MGKSAVKRKMTAERLDKLKMFGRRKYLMKKEVAGSITDEERTELAALPKPLKGRPSKPMVDVRAEPIQDDVAPPVAEGDEAQPDPGATPPPPPPRPSFTPPKEPPPRVEVLSGDWRKKYRQKTGREGACIELATVYCAALTRASSYIAASGQTPIFGAEEIQRVIFPAAVLAADKLIPADFEMSPEVEVTITSGMLLGQALLVRWRSKPQSKPATLRSVPPAPPPPQAPPRPVESQSAPAPTVAPVPNPGPFIPKPTDVF